jgi:hypothetical protein
VIVAHDFGHDWHLSDGRRGLLSWYPSGELVLSHPDGRQFLLAVIIDEMDLRRRLSGWADHSSTREGLGWLASRLEGCR